MWGGSRRPLFIPSYKFGRLNMDEQLIEAIQHLKIVCAHADEDCPAEYRTKWFNPALEDAYEFIRKIQDKSGD